MLAVILTGVVLGSIGTSYALLFVISSVVCTALVELRGLFLTVAPLPFFWFFGVTGIGVVSNWDAFASGSKRTALLNAAFPSLTYFLWLVAAMVICIIVAVARYQLDAAAQSRQDRQRRAHRSKLAQAEEANQRLNTRVRDTGRENKRVPERAAERDTEQAAEPAAERPAGEESKTRTRSAAELRRASQRRNRAAQNPDSPLDLS